MAETLTLEEVGRHSTQADKASQKSGEVCLKVAEFRKYEVIARAHIEAREGDVGEMIAKLRAFADQHHERPRYDSRGRLVAVHNWAAEAADLLAAKEAEITELTRDMETLHDSLRATATDYDRLGADLDNALELVTDSVALLSGDVSGPHQVKGFLADARRFLSRIQESSNG